MKTPMDNDMLRTVYDTAIELKNEGSDKSFMSSLCPAQGDMMLKKIDEERKSRLGETGFQERS